MPFADNQGVRIHYEIDGKGPPLVLQHGFSDSLQTWYELGYVDALKQDYRLILVDARGHGASDKPHEPEAYKPASNAADVVSVLTDLGISRAHFFGYSMGGWIAFAMAQYAPQHVHSLVIGGGNPKPPAMPDAFLEALRRQGVEAIPALWGVPIESSLRARLLANDVQALIAYRTQRLANPGFLEILPTMTMPCLVFAGEADPVYPANKEFVTPMPNATFFSLPGLGHADTFFRSDLVLPHVTQFLRAVTAQARD
jgi:pimeloyl-ACP methyl ester carboxylesterase